MAGAAYHEQGVLDRFAAQPQLLRIGAVHDPIPNNLSEPAPLGRLDISLHVDKYLFGVPVEHTRHVDVRVKHKLGAATTVASTTARLQAHKEPI